MQKEFQVGEEGFEVGRLSKINSAGLINLRFHSLWIDCNRDARKGKFASWNADLDRVWCELAGDEEEDNDNCKRFDKLNKNISTTGPLVNWKQVEGFENIDSTKESKKKLQYTALITKEIFLRRVFNKQGKGTAYIDEDDWE